LRHAIAHKLQGKRHKAKVLIQNSLHQTKELLIYTFTLRVHLYPLHKTSQSESCPELHHEFRLLLKPERQILTVNNMNQ